MYLTGLAVFLNALPIAAIADDAVRDPTRPNDVSESTPVPGSEFEVTAIFFSKERKHAVVNGRLVAEGDRVDGAKVTQIRPNAIDLLYRDESITRAPYTAELQK